MDIEDIVFWYKKVCYNKGTVGRLQEDRSTLYMIYSCCMSLSFQDTDDTVIIIDEIRCYFMDLGVANYYLKLTGTDLRTLAGALNENFVYINLKKRQDFPPTTAMKALQSGKADKLLYLKGDTKGGVDKNIETVPIYTLEEYRF